MYISFTFYWFQYFDFEVAPIGLYFEYVDFSWEDATHTHTQRHLPQSRTYYRPMWTLSQWPTWWNTKFFSPGVANSSVGETWFARSRDDSKGAAWPEIPHQHGSQLPKCTPDAFCAPCRQLLSLGVWILFFIFILLGKGAQSRPGFYLSVCSFLLQEGGLWFRGNALYNPGHWLMDGGAVLEGC